MATQNGGERTKLQTEIELLYKSLGHQDQVQGLEKLITLVDQLKKDLGGITMPAIKGLKGVLREAGELNKAIESLVRQGSVAAVKPLREGATPAEKTAHAEALKVQVSNTALRQAQLDTQDKTLRLQRQLAAETAKELQQKAFQGKLTKKEIEAQKGNVENLKAIAKGYKEASDSGIKPQVLLQRKVNNLIEADITARKQAQQKQRAAETQTRLEQNKIAVKFARQSLEGKNTGLAAYLKTADLNQVKAIESAMKAQSLKAGYTPTTHSQKLTEMVAARRADLTGVSKQVIDPKSILQSIQSAKHKGETDYIIKQLRAELNRQTKVGASRDSLVGLHGLLADARSEAVKKFAPVSPFQEAKKAEEAHAKSLAKLNESQLKQQNNRLLLEEHLQASKIRSHKTNMTIGSAEWKAEQSYQDLLKQRISAIKAVETEQKRKDKDPIGTRISEATKTTRDANVDTILKNRQTAAEKAAQRALDNEAKTKAITEGRFKTEQQIADLKQHELKFAKDTLNFGIQTGKLKGQERLDAEKYLGLIKQREAKEAAERKRSSQERTQRGKDELSRALEFINPNLASKEKLVEHIKGLQTVKNVNSEIQASQIRLKKGNISVLSTEWEKEKAYQKALKARLAIIKDVSKVILDRDAKHIRDKTLLATIANRRTAAEKAQARAEYDAEKRRALQTGKLLDPSHIKELKTDFEKKLAKDALNFGISTGFFNHQGVVEAGEMLKLLKPISQAKKAATPLTDAQRRLKEQADKLREDNVDYTLRNRQVSADRAKQKARDEFSKAKAYERGDFNTQEKTNNLKGQQLKFAVGTLKFALDTGMVVKDQVNSVKEHLDVLQKRVREEGKSTQQNQNLANLAHKYNTIAEIRNLKTKEEAELARKVVGYRMRTQRYDEEGLKNQQKLLDAAKSRDHLLTAQAHRQDRERQNERRLGQLTHLEGDGGASMAIVQAGFMMRSQVLGGLSSIFSGAFDSAIQLDKAFRNLQAISASTNYEMATMKVNLINVAQASKFSASEVGETAVMLAQTGLSIQEIGASMKGIITLAQATGTDLAKSVDVVTSVLSIFNKSATETDTIVNQLTAALNESKLDINKMALGLQYAGNIANDSGVSFEELTAALGATANAGIRSGSTLGTGLRQMFIDLQKPNEKLTKRLEILGITLDQVNFRSQGLEGVLRNLRNAGFSSADAFETFEVRSAAAFSALSGNLTDFHDLQEELVDTNAAFDANNVQMESFAVQLDHLKSNLGVAAAEGLKPVLSLLRDFARELAHAMENAEEGSTVLRVLTTSFAALTVGATLAWFAKLVWHIGTTTAALMGLGRAVSLTAFGWVGLVAAIITGLTAWESATAETARLNTELDEAKGKYNDLKAALSSYGSELTNVDGAIKDLINRYGVLSADTTQTEAVTKSLMSQFEKLGLVIDDVGSKHIDTVLQKMRELRAEMAKKLLSDTYETAAAEENKLYKELTAAEKTIRDNPALSTEDQALYVRKIISAEPKDLAKYEQVASAPAGKAVEAAKFALQIRKSLDSKEVSEELRTGFKELLQGLASTFEYSGKVPLDVFSAARTEYQIKSELGILQDKVAKRKLEQALAKVMKQIEAVERTFDNPERLEKLRGETDRAAFKIQAKEIGYQPDKLLGLSQNLLANFNKELKGVNDQNHPIDLKRQLHSILAEEYLDQSGQYLETVKKAVIEAKEQGKSSMFIEELERQIGEASELQHNYRKLLLESNKKLNKIRLNTLNEELKEAEAALKFAEEDFKLSTGSRRADGKYKVVQQKRQTVNELRKNILKLKLADNPESEETLESFDRKINSEAKSHNLDKDKFYESFKERAAESKNANLLEQGKKDLEARKAAQEDFFKGLEREKKTLEARQEAERFQATAKTYRPLTTGNMFDQLNAEDKKAAQARANATGVSQEYSVLGKVKGTFSRQAARFDNESLQKKQVQEKLALEVSQLADLQQQQRNQNIAEYNKNLEKEAKLLAEVNQLKETFEDSRAEVDKKAFDNKKSELDLIQDTNKAYREAEEKLNEAIDSRSNTIENLKNNLQALIDKYDLLDTTMSAGVQSMTSGLSSIFSDWASGVIQNTEDVRDAFEALGKSVLQSMAKVVSDRIAQQFMGFILNGLGSMFGGSGEINLGMDAPTQVMVSTGGLITTSGVKHFARGGEVGGTNIGRDSVAALLQPNEYVVQRSAVQALGTDFMQNLNNVTAGSLKQGAANLGGSKPMVQNVMKSSPPVNVYVVSPEQQRQMGQEDVVVALQDDILRGGTTKKLIKAVITGEI